MVWQNLYFDILDEFAHYGVAYVTRDGETELPYVAHRFPEDECTPGQRWLDGNELERAALVASLEAIARARDIEASRLRVSHKRKRTVEYREEQRAYLAEYRKRPEVVARQRALDRARYLRRRKKTGTETISS